MSMKRSICIGCRNPIKAVSGVMSNMKNGEIYAVESNLTKARFKLMELPIDKIFLAITPMPDRHYDLPPEAREQFILKLQKLLGLPKDSLLETPLSLPYELYSDSSHFNGKGRAVFTKILRHSLLNAL